MPKEFTFFITFLCFWVMDVYVFQAIKFRTKNFKPSFRKGLFIFYWFLNITVAISFWTMFSISDYSISRYFKEIILGLAIVNYVPKIFAVIILLIDDIIRLGKWVYSKFPKETAKAPISENNKITRSEFLTKAALVTGSIPFTGLTFGILSGAHDYRVRTQTVYLPHLPKAFDGIKIGQLSDIHSGSFFNKTAVTGGVEMLLKEKADIIFFTGDLVNERTKEVNEYIDIFKDVKAPLGVYSTLGNHDYGNYTKWSSQQAKNQNNIDMLDAHKALGWDLLMNENRIITEGGEKIAILGVENWGKGRFPKYGKLDEAHKGVEDIPTKLLLSHDPSHWDLQIRPNYADVDITFSGHTHGAQLGIEYGNIKWSPSKYLYKQWAGMYQEGEQYLYVNRGFGYIGYPGRLGIAPEITIIELKKEV